VTICNLCSDYGVIKWFSDVNLTATVLNCRLPTSRHINYIDLSWLGSLIMLRLQLMVCFTHISRKNRNLGFLCKTELKPNRKWNRTNHSLSREQRPRKTKIGTEVAQVTHDSDTTLKVKRSRSPGRFTHRRGNVLAVINCCYVAICSATARHFDAHGGGEGRGISWRPPQYSLL